MIDKKAADHSDLGQVVSVRVPAWLAADLRATAEGQGRSVSDVLREAAERHVGTPIGWRCRHINMTSLRGVLSRPTSYCGCDLRPVHRAAREPTA